MAVPVRLDALVPATLRPSGATEDSERQRQSLFGVWLVATVVVGCAFLLLVLAVATWPVGALGALVTAVPASMALLRGVVDAVSPSGRLPKYTTSTASWLACYVVAAGGLLFAFVA